MPGTRLHLIAANADGEVTTVVQVETRCDQTAEDRLEQLRQLMLGADILFRPAGLPDHLAECAHNAMEPFDGPVESITLYNYHTGEKQLFDHLIRKDGSAQAWASLGPGSWIFLATGPDRAWVALRHQNPDGWSRHRIDITTETPIWRLMPLQGAHSAIKAALLEHQEWLRAALAA